MKTTRIYLGIFALCFIVGLGLLIMSPATTVAGPDPCNSHCSITKCALPGPYGCTTQYAYVRCYAWAYEVCDPEFPVQYNCRCNLIYCTDEACNIQ
ncbi:MAG: hypothetical protein WAU88_00240 [Candidatus Zixiibacteriota bacterium]